MAIAETILSEPTAPFHEEAVLGAIRGLLAPCHGVSLREDAFGNLIAHYQGTDPTPARLAFCAHMDHPGWAPDRPGIEGTRDGQGRVFLGGVGPDYLAANQGRVRAFGPFAMWDLPAFEGKDGQIWSRACDDLIGCAAIIATLEELDRQKAPFSFYGLFTRAEEIGFGGAIAMARDGWLQQAGVTVISLETSAERPPARIGGGAIVRVGDRQSIFDPAVTAELLAGAARAEIEVQRCLMSGGTCEATAFHAYGVRCGALCIALGNYHNRGPELRIEPEYVSASDFEGLTALCIELASAAPVANDAIFLLRERLERNLRQYSVYNDASLG